MKKIYTFLTFVGLSTLGFSQNVIYSEDFESGNSFTLNTTDESSTAAGENMWIVNDQYTGGSFNFNCPGFGTFPANSPSNSTQPAGTTNGPESNYLHITTTQGSAQGVGNATYISVDGICVLAESYFARMTNDISTTGETGVSLSFIWACGGASGAIYGEVFYSTDGGTNWTVINTPIQQYSGQSNWTNQTITNAAFDNQSTLRFGFKFTNTSSGSAADPSFAIDEIEVTSPAPTPEINITENYDAIHCEEGSIDIDYTSSNVTFNAGNNFSLEMSDNVGSFASPTVIGTINSTATSGTITGTFPAATSGSGYLLRIVSDNPAVTSANGTTTLTLNPMVDTSVTVTDVDMNAAATGVNYTWLDCDANQLVSGETSQNFAPFNQGNYALVVTDNDGACIDTSSCYFINAGAAIRENNSGLIKVYPNPAKEYIQIQSNKAVQQNALINVFGQIVYRGTSNYIDVSSLAAGVYFLKLEFEDQVLTKKIVVE